MSLAASSIHLYGMRGELTETWVTAWANRGGKAETPKQLCRCLMLRSPYFYPTPLSFEVIFRGWGSVRFYDCGLAHRIAWRIDFLQLHVEPPFLAVIVEKSHGFAFGEW